VIQKKIKTKFQLLLKNKELKCSVSTEEKLDDTGAMLEHSSWNPSDALQWTPGFQISCLL
jgi:hypothetical protein